MPELLAFILAAVFVVIAVHKLSSRTGLPAAALLTVSGILYALLPGPNLQLDPDVVLTFVLPPLLYSAALGSSLTAIRGNLRAVISLSVGLVLATALPGGLGLDLVVPGIGPAAGVALGAAVSPPDPVAALSVGRRARLPARLTTLPLATESGAPFPSRDLLLFCTYLVVLVTPVGQGATLVPVVRAAGVRGDPTEAASTRNQARTASIRAALVRLDELAEGGDVAQHVLADLRTTLDQRARRYQRRQDVLEVAEDGELPDSAELETALRG